MLSRREIMGERIKGIKNKVNDAYESFKGDGNPFMYDYNRAQLRMIVYRFNNDVDKLVEAMAKHLNMTSEDINNINIECMEFKSKNGNIKNMVGVKRIGMDSIIVGASDRLMKRKSYSTNVKIILKKELFRALYEIDTCNKNYYNIDELYCDVLKPKVEREFNEKWNKFDELKIDII